MKNKINLFNYPKLIEILGYLYIKKESIISDIARENNIQFSYVSIKIKVLEEIGLVDTKRQGRKTFITLTKKGSEIGRRINEIQEVSNG